MNKLLKHLENVNRRAETWPKWKKDILNQRIGGAEVYDNSVCRDHFPTYPIPWAETDIEIVSQPKEKCFYFETEPYKFDDAQFKLFVKDYVMNIHEQVDNEICLYLNHKLRLDIIQLKKWIENCNNLKLKGVEFHKQCYPDRDEYYDGSFCFMVHCKPTVYAGKVGNDRLVRYWDKEEK